MWLELKLVLKHVQLGCLLLVLTKESMKGSFQAAYQDFGDKLTIKATSQPKLERRERYLIRLSSNNSLPIGIKESPATLSIHISESSARIILNWDTTECQIPYLRLV